MILEMIEVQNVKWCMKLKWVLSSTCLSRIITARIRRMGEGNVFSLFTSWGGGQVQLAGGVKSVSWPGGVRSRWRGGQVSQPTRGGSGQSADGRGVRSVNQQGRGGQVQPAGGGSGQSADGGRSGQSAYGVGGQHFASSCGRYASCVHAGGLSCLDKHSTLALGENCALAANQSVDCCATIIFTISLKSAKVWNRGFNSPVFDVGMHKKCANDPVMVSVGGHKQDKDTVLLLSVVDSIQHFAGTFLKPLGVNSGFKC